MKVSVLGCGRWGSFIAWYLCNHGHEVYSWGPEDDYSYQVLKETGKMNEALIYYEKNLKCTEELGKKIGGEESLQYLINAYVAIGEVLRNLGREKEAKQYETKATLCKMFFT